MDLVLVSVRRRTSRYEGTGGEGSRKEIEKIRKKFEMTYASKAVIE